MAAATDTITVLTSVMVKGVDSDSINNNRVLHHHSKWLWLNSTVTECNIGAGSTECGSAAGTTDRKALWTSHRSQSVINVSLFNMTLKLSMWCNNNTVNSEYSSFKDEWWRKRKWWWKKFMPS